MGAPDEVIDAADGGTIYVWKRTVWGVTRETAVAVLEEGRMVMSIHSSGGIRDVKAQVAATRRHGVVPPHLKPLLGIDDVGHAADAWARLPYIQWRLESSGGRVPELDARLVARFDGVEPGMSYAALVAFLGDPEQRRRDGSSPSCRWTWDGAELTVSLEDDRVTAKRLETEDREVHVRENAWWAQEKTNRAVRIRVEP